ncbi:hypothetical protein GCM10022221_81000 [Actinocorallia aurea]
MPHHPVPSNSLAPARAAPQARTQSSLLRLARGSIVWRCAPEHLVSRETCGTAKRIRAPGATASTEASPAAATSHAEPAVHHPACALYTEATKGTPTLTPSIAYPPAQQPDA